MYISGTNYPIYPNEMPQAGVQLKLDRSGLVTVFTGGNDIGQGSNSVVAYIVAEELGLELRDVRVVAADTDLCPVDLGAYSCASPSWSATRPSTPAASCARRSSTRVAEHWQVARRARAPRARARRSIARIPRAVDPDARGVPARRGALRHARRDRLVQHARSSAATTAAARSAPRRPTRSPRTWPRSTSTSRPARHGARRSGSRTTAAARSIPMLVEGQIEGSAYMGFAEALMEEHDVNRFGPAPRALAARLPHPDLARHARDARADRRVRRSRGPVRRQGGRRGPAALRRSPRSPTRSTTRVGIRLRPPAVHARQGAACPARAACEPAAPVGTRARREPRSSRSKRPRSTDHRSTGPLMLRLPDLRAARAARPLDEAVALLGRARPRRDARSPAAPTSCRT